MSQRIRLDIGTTTYTWDVSPLTAVAVLEALAGSLGCPDLTPRAGEVGKPEKEVTIEPIEAPEPVKVPEPAPREPVPA